MSQNLKQQNMLTDSGTGRSTPPVPTSVQPQTPTQGRTVQPAVVRPTAVADSGTGRPLSQNQIPTPPARTATPTPGTAPTQAGTAPTQSAGQPGATMTMTAAVPAAPAAPAAQTPVQAASAEPTAATAQVKPYETTYVGADGKSYTGYIIDGTTYADAAGTTPVGVGSIVTTVDGTRWIKTDRGSMRYDDYLAQQSAPREPPQIPQIEGNLPDWQGLLNQWLTSAQAQASGRIDYATQQGINELQRAEEDARQGFQDQRDQIAANEAIAKDNRALYAERRGDRGGIGAAQYDSIMNTAARNQLSVNLAQQKLSTDTARQISDLRAQGEYQKADELLQLSQTYLSQLITLQQWATQYNLSVDQFNTQVQQWNAEFQAKVADLTGYYQGQRTLQGQQIDFNNAMTLAGLTGFYNGAPTLEMRSQLAEAGLAAANAGITPSESQLAALTELYGYTPAMVQGMVQTAQLAQLTGSSSGGSRSGGGSGGSSRSSGGGSGGSGSDVYEQLADAGATDYGTAYAVLRGMGYGVTDANRYAKYFADTYYPGLSSDTAGLGPASDSAPRTAPEPIIRRQEQTDSGTGSAGAAKETINTSSFMRSVATLLRSGNRDGAAAEIERIWPLLTAAQRKTLQDQVLAKYGWGMTWV